MARLAASVLIVLFSLCSPALAKAAAEAPQPLIEQFKLKNGMEVIVLPNHRVPAVSHMLWYRIGAADDPVGKSGLTHYVEHMMFRGNDEYKPGDYSQIIMQHGGNQNAFTNRDMTAYYANIAKKHLPLVMKMERSRMMGIAPEVKDAEREREVIIEERRSRIDTKPRSILFEEINAALFLHHPYQTPVIGWLHEMQGLTAADVRDWHKKYYQPDNAVLVVAGDITAEELKPLAEEYYGDLPPGKRPERHWVEEPPQRAERKVILRSADVQQPMWMREYQAPSLIYGKKELALPLFVLAQVLGGGESSRLNQSIVVKQKLATEISTDYDGVSLGPATFSVFAIPADEAGIGKMAEAIDAELKKIMDAEISEAELTRAKTQLKAETLYARDGLQSMAYIVGQLRMLGLPAELVQQWPDMIDKVTVEEVRAAAGFVLELPRSVTGVLLPDDKAKAGAK